MVSSSMSRSVCLLLLSLVLCQSVVHGVATDSELKSLHLRRRTDKPLVEVIKDAVNELTELSDKQRIKIERISPYAARFVSQGIVESLVIIIGKVTDLTKALESGTNPSTLDDDDAKEVVEVLTDFVEVHRQLLSVVIQKRGILLFPPFSEPIRSALVQVQDVVDSFEITLIDLIPTQVSTATQLLDSLGLTINQAVATYGPIPKSSLAGSLNH